MIFIAPLSRNVPILPWETAQDDRNNFFLNDVGVIDFSNTLLVLKCHRDRRFARYRDEGICARGIFDFD